MLIFQPILGFCNVNLTIYLYGLMADNPTLIVLQTQNVDGIIILGVSNLKLYSRINPRAHPSHDKSGALILQ